MPIRKITARAAPLLILAAGGFAVSPAPIARADIKDYRFELVGAPVKAGATTLIKVRLTHLPDGKPVTGAIIIRTKLDMGPDGMVDMTAPAKVSSAAEAGIYQIEAEPGMPGKWALTLGAKIQGERETMSGTVTVPIAK